MVPLGFARVLSIIQTIFGVILAGIWIGIAVLKITSPARDSIVFSKFAFYDLKEERFVVVFVNINRQKLIDVNISTILKLVRYNPIGYALSAPYIGESVWPFSVDKVPLSDLRNHCESLDEGDGLKVSISGPYPV